MAQPMARCKFRVQNVQKKTNLWDKEGNPAGHVETVLMHTQYDADDPEDTRFSTATPWGTLEFGLSNPALLGKFERDAVFYLGLVPVA